MRFRIDEALPLDESLNSFWFLLVIVLLKEYGRSLSGCEDNLVPMSSTVLCINSGIC